MNLARSVFVLLLASICSLATAAKASNETGPLNLTRPVLSLGAGLEYETGDYGSGETIDTWRLPLLVEWFPVDRLSLRLEIPFVRQSGSSDAVLIGGSSTATRGQGQGAKAASSGAGASTLVRTSNSQSGLGDIKLNAAFSLLPKTAGMPRLLALLYAKFPTADEEKGLGTGAFDWGGGLGIGNNFGDWSSYAELFYIAAGSSDDFAPDPYLEWLAALSYRAGTRMRPGLALSGGTAPFDDGEDPLEVRAQLGILGGEQTSYSLAVSRGLSDGSPEWGLSVFAYFDF